MVSGDSGGHGKGCHIPPLNLMRGILMQNIWKYADVNATQPKCDLKSVNQPSQWVRKAKEMNIYEMN